jgi:hypothetical protein
MKQQEFDFNRDINEPIFKSEESLLIDEIVSVYEAKSKFQKDEKIMFQLFFEEHCIEISKRLKFLGFFNGEWKLDKNSFELFFFDFIKNKITFDSSTLSEFIISLLGKLKIKVETTDFQNNSISVFSFDRKITESILEQIQVGKIHNATLIYIVYLKIWNHFKIYNDPFNNNKAWLIHKIFSESIWKKNLISYEAFSEFEKSVQTQIILISNNHIYFPFFDIKDRSYYLEKYLQMRNKLKENIEKLYEYDNTDESEPYRCLIKDLISQPSDNAYKKELIRLKVDKQMMPNEEDIRMFIKLFESSSENKFGKWLLSKFYLFNYLNYENK